MNILAFGPPACPFHISSFHPWLLKQKHLKNLKDMHPIIQIQVDLKTDPVTECTLLKNTQLFSCDMFSFDTGAIGLLHIQDVQGSNRYL
jgi:hypothetical protein